MSQLAIACTAESVKFHFKDLLITASGSTYTLNGCNMKACELLGADHGDILMILYRWVNIVAFKLSYQPDKIASQKQHE